MTKLKWITTLRQRLCNIRNDTPHAHCAHTMHQRQTDNETIPNHQIEANLVDPVTRTQHQQAKKCSDCIADKKRMKKKRAETN